jgi:arginase family enzyme
MSIDIVVSQGRIADKTAMTIEGAARTARALAQRTGATPTVVGTPSPPAIDDWRESLPQARETLAGLAKALDAAIARGGLTLLASNTCSASLASLPVVARRHPDAVLLWVDAHGDFNTPETTETGYLGGMVVAAACGLWDSGHGAGLRPQQVIMVGARDIDPPEAELLKTAGVRVIPPAEVSPEAVLAAVGDAPVWVHVDWDVLEPGYVPADYDVPGGLLPTQIRAILAAFPKDRVLGVELAEFNVPADEAKAEAALATILDTVSPLLD